MSTMVYVVEKLKQNGQPFKTPVFLGKRGGRKTNTFSLKHSLRINSRQKALRMAEHVNGRFRPAELALVG